MKSILIITIILALSIVYSGIGIFKEGKLLKENIDSIIWEINDLEEQIKKTNNFKDYEPQELVKFYIDFFNNIKLISAFNNVTFKFFIPESKNRIDVGQFFKNSQYEGVKIVDVKVIFKAKNMPSIISILEILTMMQKEYPIEIIGIRNKKDYLECDITLYGIRR